MSLMSQTRSVIVMNVRSIPQRLWMSLATVVSIALVVAVLLGFLSLANGFSQTLKGSGAPDVAIVLRDGAEAELNSTLSRVISVAPSCRAVATMMRSAGSRGGLPGRNDDAISTSGESSASDAPGNSRILPNHLSGVMSRRKRSREARRPISHAVIGETKVVTLWA